MTTNSSQSLETPRYTTGKIKWKITDYDAVRTCRAFHLWTVAFKKYGSCTPADLIFFKVAGWPYDRLALACYKRILRGTYGLDPAYEEFQDKYVESFYERYDAIEAIIKYRGDKENDRQQAF